MSVDGPEPPGILISNWVLCRMAPSACSGVAVRLRGIARSVALLFAHVSQSEKASSTMLSSQHRARGLERHLLGSELKSAQEKSGLCISLGGGGLAGLLSFPILSQIHWIWVLSGRVC